MTINLTISLFFLLISFSLNSQDDWQLQKEKNGIKVYTQEVAGSSLKAFKSVTEIETSVASLVAVCKDVASFPEWQESTIVAKILKTKDETEHIHYLEFAAPWPVSNRDNITQFTYQFNPKDGSVRVKIQTLPDYLPEKEGVVRIKESSGYYLFTPLSNGKVQVTHSAHADPAGNIPTWLSNSVMVDTPFKTLTNLKEQVKKEKYQGKTFKFIAEADK